MEREISLDLFDDLMDIELIEESSISANDIAIVGLSVKAGEAENAEELWSALCRGEDLTREIPSARAADADAFAAYLGKTKPRYARESYLERIDQFSPGFFHIPPKDAALLDPAQRLFTETAWRALEDAGLSKRRLSESNTGVFVGYTSGPNSYSELLAESDPEYADRAVQGKVNSIIAARLSYYLNLRGPAIMVDTACSSSLVAVHMACNSIRAGECEMAIAGSVKYTLIPEDNDGRGEVSVTSANGQTRTFDVHSDGTNPGEGVAAVILKPLRKAVEEKDRIYAVIKGSAANQDGASVGITAPNAAAQEDVIVKAWENAGIDPEKVSYIEAHGTATKLGDPVEISGIERAFRRFTDKRQFCAVGSIKTNLGHLDCAAGIVGLIKCVLALSHRELPPQVHFTSPNREIDFIRSPVYINDMVTPWNPPGERICGVSSFGLSGTNCHVVLQEPSEQASTENCLPMVLPLSARNRTELQKVAEAFVADVEKNPERISDAIFTAAMSKSDYDERIAVVVEDLESLRMVLQKAQNPAIKSEPSEDKNTAARELVRKIKDSGLRKDMEALCDLYTEGAEVSWADLYEQHPVRIVSLTGYPMGMERCWETPKRAPMPVYKTEQEPLVDVCLTASPMLHVYSTMLSELTHSEVREHIIGERNVLAGTVYVEMLRCAAKKMLQTDQLQIDGLVFMAPMIFEKEQVREAQTVLYQKSDNEIEATIQSKPAEDTEWTVHIQAKISVHDGKRPAPVDVAALFDRLGPNVMDETETSVDQMVTTGPRWKVQQGIWIGEGEAVTMACPGAEFAEELKQYELYPSMLDAAVNCSSVLNGTDFCLPYYYGSMRIYKRMPQKIYSHTVKNTESSSKDGEINVFDIVIFDEHGEVLATVQDYAMKRTSERQKKQFFLTEEPLLRTTRWKLETTKYRPADLCKPGESIVVVTKADEYNKKLHSLLKTTAKTGFYELVLCDWVTKNTDRKTFVFPEDQENMVYYFEDMENRSLSRVVFLMPQLGEAENEEVLSSEIESFIHGFFNMMYALASNKELGTVAVDLLIPTERDRVSPLAMAVAGMGKSLLFEYSRLKLRSILFTPDTPERCVLDEIAYNHNDYMVWRKGEERFVPELEEIDSDTERPFRLTKGGTYLITGGTGGIGLVIAERLAELELDIHLVLAARREILPPEQWEAAEGDKYKRLCAIRRKAASVTCVCCNVADSKAVDALFEQVGSVNGIVHGAGLAGGGFVIKRQWKDFAEVIAPKINGTWNLIRQARQRNMEFVTLFSTYATVLAVAGQSDYIGANSYMDAYADYGNADGLVKVINWGGWKERGMAFDNGVDMVNSPVQFMSNAEGADAFVQAMTRTESRVLVGKLHYGELAEAMEDYAKVIHFSDTDLAMIRSSADHRKNTNKTYDITVHGKDTPLTPTEQKVAQAWAKILGLREVDYQDKFLEIGGDSMSATYLQKEIESLFPGAMDITDVFVYPTIEQMATFIDSKIVVVETKQEEKKPDTDQMRKLLEMLASGEIDVSEAGMLI